MEARRKWRSDRRFASPDDMWMEYQAFSDHCASHTVKRTTFSQQLAKHVTEDIPSPVSKSINGFCVYAGINRKTFDETYGHDPVFDDVIERMMRDCETDAREKFEDGTIPAQLAALWMGSYGYSTKQEQDITGGVPVVITGEGDLKD